MTDQDRAIQRVRCGEAVAAPHNRCVERDQIELGAEAEFLLNQPPGGVQFRNRELRIEEEFAGIVPGLGVDGDAAGVVGGKSVVGPERVSEPSLRLAQRDQLAAARMIEVDRGAFFATVDFGDAGLS